MRAMDAENIDAIVSDPPYGLSFMGKGWDHGVPGQDFWIEALRVAKPGAHLLAFGGTRTFHRLVVAIEDAGWEIRDCLMWVYGSGFPKSLNIGGGWGTALKPAYEPIIMARKPLTSTVAANVLKHGTGAINVDGCRIATTDGDDTARVWRDTPSAGKGSSHIGQAVHHVGSTSGGNPLGRWPANVLHDGSDEVTGLMGDAARFFYCAKASKTDRDEGCDGLNVKKRTDGRESEHHTGHLRTTERSNHHPTVKPTDLMRYLCRLVTPPGGTVLDPFMGSGSTGKAATLEGFSFVGCELQLEYMAIAEARILHAEGDVEPLLRVRT
jgi:site-specific DNA-methyltransferase (adenine-specific)